MDSKYEYNLQTVEKLLKNLFLNKGNLGEDNEYEEFSLMIAYMIPDKRFFKTLLKKYGDKLKLVNNKKCQNLIMTIVEDGNWNILFNTLDKCNITELDELFLIKLSLSIIKRNRIDIFKEVVQKYFKGDGYLTNGESFLTNSIKTVEDEDLIIMIIHSMHFNINLPNGNKETPLILACERLMVKVVKALVHHGCDINYDNKKAVDVTISKSKISDEKVKEIIKLLLDSSNKNDQDLRREEVYSKCSTVIEFLSEDITKVLTDIITLIINYEGDIVKEDSSGVNILSLAYTIPSKSIFTMFIDACKNNLSLLHTSSGQSLVKKIILDKDYTLFINVLCRCELTKQSDDFLLNLALLALKQDKCDVCTAILKRCFDINKILNKETFITNLFKENIDERIIFEIIKLKRFDLNILNESKETCLIIACKQLMTDMVDILLQYGSDPSIENYKAIEVVINSEIIDLEVNIKTRNKILDLFFCNKNLILDLNKKICVRRCKTGNQNSKVVQEIQYAKQDNYQIQLICTLHNSGTSLLEMFVFALFAKSDYMDYVFLNKQIILENCCHIKELKDFLSTQIVYPLRKYGFINRETIGIFAGIIKKEKLLPLIKQNEMSIEDISKIISLLSHGEDILRFVNYTNNANYLSLFANFSETFINISIQDLFNIYMAQQNKIFSQIPASLILEVPRGKKGYGNVINIIPSEVLDLSNLFIKDYVCCNCNLDAILFCTKCVEINKYNIMYGFKCSFHNCSHSEVKSLKYSDQTSMSIIQMNLSAVICYEKDHFVAYIKNKFNGNWNCFNSCSGPYIPDINFDDRISQFLNRSDKEKLNEVFGRNPLHLRQILKDSYIFFYENGTITCY